MTKPNDTVPPEPAAQKCILIRFGDNDFGTTLRAFADVLTMPSGRNFADGFLTKAKVAELWNMLAPGLYFTVQNRGRYTPASSNVAKYLQISPDRVCLDDEALQYIDENQGQWNGEWVYIGLDGSPNTTI